MCVQKICITYALLAVVCLCTSTGTESHSPPNITRSVSGIGSTYLLSRDRFYYRVTLCVSVVFTVALCLSVHLSVCLSYSCILCRWLKILSNFIIGPVVSSF